MNKKNNIPIALFLILIVSISQFILASKHLEMGFFTDDWLFLSLYRTFVANPILDISNAWKEIGSHNFGYVYYLGVLHNFFGLDYFSYRLLNQILKIIATLSLYPLILYISRNKLLAFLSTFIYAIHYSSFGLLDGPSRGGDFLAIAFMNIFLAGYFYISKKKVINIPTLFIFAAWLFTTILLGPTRLFPLLAIVPMIEILNFTTNKAKYQLKEFLKRFLILYSPLFLLFIFSPKSIIMQLGYFGGLFEKLKDQNWQLLLTPFAALGSTYIPSKFWPFFGTPVYDSFNSFFSFFLFGPFFIYCTTVFLLGFFISNKLRKFIVRSLVLNILIGIVVFLIAHNWSYLNVMNRAPVDPGVFFIPSLIGLFIVTISFSLFLEWKESKKEGSLLPFIFLGPIFSLTFIVLTWIFADINSIFMGVHAYLNIPSIGTSVFLGTILILVYKKLILLRLLGRSQVVSICLVLVLLVGYFKLNFNILDQYFSRWLSEGASSIDQKRILSQFWSEVGNLKKYSKKELPLIYLGNSEEYENGAYYEQVITWRMASWFDLKYNQSKESPFSSCEIEIRGKEELEKFVKISEDGKTLISDKCGYIINHKLENFYAFKLKNRDLISNKSEVLKDLGILY